MSDNTPSNSCLNCNRSENEIPLVALSYAGDEARICSQCLPVLIQRPYEQPASWLEPTAYRPRLPTITN